MKITFEGKTFGDILDQMTSMLSFTKITAATGSTESTESTASTPVKIAQGPGPDPFMAVDKPVNIPVDIPREKVEKPSKSERSEKQRAAAARMRAAKEAKKAAKNPSGMPPLPVAPPPASAEGMDPAEVARIRIKTTEELQEAYANGFQKEVFELLARFGNGAKSFRELPVEAFVPIREAIDNGALT